MPKYILLKSVVPSTFDGGFRCNGYEIVDAAERDVQLPSSNFCPIESCGYLDQILEKKIRDKAAEIAVRRSKV